MKIGVFVMSILIEADFKFINELIDKYTNLYIRRDFLNENIERYIDIDEAKKGLGIANILATSRRDESKKLALKISTLISTVIEDPIVLKRCINIMSTLSIFTFSSVLKNRKGYDENIFQRDGLSLFEKLYREEFFSRKIAGEKVTLNKFQLIVNDAITNYKNISVSAPTSIGKSYLMKKVILNTIVVEENSKIIYVVPTRALINQVMNDIQEEIINLHLDEKVVVTCSSEITEDIQQRKCIFILTQERLNQLCCNIDKKFNINLIVIDEAQQIAEGSRGILLEYTIRRVKEIWSNIKIFFISPLIDNSEVFIKRFRLEESYFKNESLPTVNQNVIYIQKQRRKSFLEIRSNNSIIGKIGFISSKLPTLKEKIAYIYNNFNNGENSIIYCNKQSSTRNIVNEIIKYDEFIPIKDNELNEFSDFLKQYICDKYDLVDLIKRGVAYHYSMIPNIIKMGIEDLAQKGKLKVIACTSTLLEGINVQANNIYIYNPKKNTEFLSDLEFWNLSGRAGRMKNDICGNIICIDINNQWNNEGYFQKNIEDIDFKKNKILSNDVEKFKNYLMDKDSIPNNKENKGIIDSYKNLESVLLLEKIDGKDILEEYNKNDVMKNIDVILNNKIEENNVPEELLKKLIGIDIEVINRLWMGFEKNYSRIENLYLLNPFMEKADERLDRVLKIINKVFLNGMYSKEYLCAVKVTILKWIREKGMKEIIFYDFDLNINNSEQINKKIEEGLNFLNKTVRYEFSKLIYAYQEVLNEFLILKDKQELIEKQSNYSLYLEFGASRKKTLELMALGMFREGAIIVSKYIQSEDRNEIYKELKKLDINNININKFMKKKIIEKIKIL